MTNQNIDVLWDDNPVDITSEANFIWSIANKLRGVYMPDKYGDVIIPMTIIRRLECALETTKQAVVDQFKKNPTYPEKAMYRISGYQFYNTSEFTLKELCNDADHIEANFKAYVESFSSNVQSLLNDEDTLNLKSHIKTMSKGGCLYTVVKAFSELDLSPATYDSIKMGYIFENLIGRFFQNVDAGQYYTGRDIIKMCVSLLIAEGCDDIFEDGKIITVCDQACGTGGMLSTAYSYLKHYNPTSDVRLFGQEYNGVSYAIGLAEMLIKGQNAENFRHADTFKEDCFKGTKMRFILENPPFGTPWSGKDAKEGQEQAVNDEYAKGLDGRWGAGLPSGGDAQLIFIQSAIDKMDDNNGIAKIEGYFFLDPADIEAFNKLLYESEHTAKDKKQMTFYLQKAKRVIDSFSDEDKAQCAMDIRHFIRFYEFLLQASCFEDKELHKKYNFLNYLISYIKINHPGGGYNLEGKIRATGFIQKKTGEYKKPQMKSDPVMKLPTAYDIVLTPAKEERLSQIIIEINNRTGRNYDNDVAIKAALQIRDIMKKSEELKTSAKNNTEQDFEFAFFDHVDDALIDGLEQNQDFFTLLLQNDEIKKEVLGLFVEDTYQSLRAVNA
jgi:type I restriction-modification